MINQSGVGFGVCWVRLSAFSSMVTTSNLTDQDITKLILESDSDAHSLEGKDTIAQSDSDTCDITDTCHIVEWQYKLSTYGTCSPQVNMRSQRVMPEAPHINKDSSPLSIFMLFFFKKIQLLVEETHRHYTTTWTHWMKDGPHHLMWLFRKCICFWQLLCRWGTIWQTHWKITDQHQNSTLWPFMEALWNETDSITYIDFNSVKTIKMNPTRQMKITNDNGK